MPAFRVRGARLRGGGLRARRPLPVGPRPLRVDQDVTERDGLLLGTETGSATLSVAARDGLTMDVTATDAALDVTASGNADVTVAVP